VLRSTPLASRTGHVNLVTYPLICHKWGKDREVVRQVEHTRGHLRHRYSITVNQVMVTIVTLSKWWCDLYYISATQGSLIPYILRTNLISIIHQQRYFFISRMFDMYCGDCHNIPFWRWLKGNQTFHKYVTCIDYDRETLSSLQPNDFSACFSEYLCIFKF
jgi:hypothetical protein